MKKILCTSLVAASFVFTASAYSAQGVYVSGDFGVAMANDIDVDLPYAAEDVSLEFDTGWGALGAIGYRMDNFRVEAEIGYQANDYDQAEFLGFGTPLSGDVTTLSFLANGYWDFYNTSKWTPFLTAGLGWAEVEVNDMMFPGDRVGWSEDDGVFVWQVGAGVSYAVNPNFDVELKYRFMMTDDLELADYEDLYEVDGPSSHNIYLGMRYNF